MPVGQNQKLFFHLGKRKTNYMQPFDPNQISCHGITNTVKTSYKILLCCFLLQKMTM